MTASSSSPSAPSGRVPLWLVLEGALADASADPDRVRVPPRAPEPRVDREQVAVAVSDLVLVVLTVAVLLVAAAAVLLLPAVR